MSVTDALAPDASPSRYDLLTVATYWDPMEAQVARLRLAHEEIPTFLEKEFTVQVAWHFTNAIGGIRLNVPATRFGESLQLLQNKELFGDWAPSRCWEWSLNGIPAVTEEESLAVARDLDFKEPLTQREELAERALRAAMLGVHWEIPFLFACVHLWRFYNSEDPCRPACRAKANWARGMTIAVASIFVVLVLMLWAKWYPSEFVYLERNREDPRINALRP